MTDDINTYVGLDVHKDSIAVAIAPAGREEAVFHGEIGTDAGSLKRLLKGLGGQGRRLSFCYEAGPCGYGLYRTLVSLGHECEVVAPSMTPRRAGERIKTDRRDALMLARLHRAGELHGVWVPDEEQESIRDLTRAREDMKALELRSRQRLGAFLLRHGLVYREGKSRWTKRHWRWLSEQRLPSAVQQLVFQEYIESVRQCQRQVASLEAQMHEALSHWSLAEVAYGLMALRGVSLVTAMGVLAELGDITRFDNPRELMAYLGLVPSEHSSGRTRRQGAITRTGNGHVRRLLVEAAWNYRFPARRSRDIERRGAHTSVAVQAIAWAGQKRLCARYRYLLVAGKSANQVTVAVARELAGFIWAIACQVNGKAHGSKALA